MTCNICLERECRGANWMCEACGRSYDRNAHHEGTVAEAMRWAAERARRFERARVRARLSWKVRDLVRLVTQAGGVWDPRRGKGRHHVFLFADGTHVSIPVGGSKDADPKMVMVVRKKLASLRAVGSTK